MILIDFSQIMMAPIFNETVGKAAACEPCEKSKDILRHMVLNSLRSNTVLHKKYGNVVLGCDSGSWRREVFPEYKYERRQKRKNDDSGIDWNFVHELQTELIEDIKKYFPYTVVKVNSAEGDDIIAVMVEYLNSIATENVFGDKELEEILIVSSDADYIQLHKNKNVKQFNPRLKKLVKTSQTSIHAALMEKIVKGDKGDGVPNIRSSNDTFVLGTRQKPISQDFLDELTKAKDPLELLDPELKKNFLRNKQLVAFTEIPATLKEQIIAEYVVQSTNRPKNKMNLMNYFVENGLNQLYEKVGDFYA